MQPETPVSSSAILRVVVCQAPLLLLPANAAAIRFDGRDLAQMLLPTKPSGRLAGSRKMARKRKDDDLTWLVARLIGLFVALSLVWPPFRQAVAGIFVLLVISAVGIVLAVGIYKLVSRRGTSGEQLTFQTSSPTPVASPPSSLAPAIAKPRTTDQFVERLRAIDWFQFEQLVALVYRKQGYVVSRRGGANPDGGIDLVIEKSGTRSAVQCKHWKTWNVGVKAMREFLGALTDAGIGQGLFITLGGYTGEARQLADKHGIEVVNETGLTRMLEATDARSDPAALEILQDSRKLCPKCERHMVLRRASKGRGAGKQFWGCSGYPRCSFTMPA